MRAVALPTGAFVTNRRGYPTLPRAHQELLIDFWRQGVQVLSSLFLGSLHSILEDHSMPDSQHSLFFDTACTAPPSLCILLRGPQAQDKQGRTDQLVVCR